METYQWTIAILAAMVPISFFLGLKVNDLRYQMWHEMGAVDLKANYKGS